MISKEQVSQFAQAWFDLLSVHAPVERILPMIADRDLEMVFPERTLRSHEDFKDWYVQVGKAYAGQVHVIERIEPHEGPDARGPADGVAVDVTVVWSVTRVADGKRLTLRSRQTWQLMPSEKTQQPVILRYRIHSLGDASAS
ncbi:hypothetical protein D7V97_08065 [Corallococcus sp. CA053C]|uniref:hypothetical protein n=1 Tax=Corallococcus sp. CA053C TaxID=2316732 RepID=UPI000EA036E6|nr:hypothetical protein [Corallococcus sp. CA053C]RKH12582.1 hypothetical protein D7V97_08065 [Corallococcus sp. CA053C]